MNAKEMETLVKKIQEQFEEEYDIIGLRFEDKERKIGEICENSRHNNDRDDERDFPEYGTEEYEDCYEFDGTSSWHIDSYDMWTDQKFTGTKHCYIIAGSRDVNKDDDLDVGEIVIEEAKVIAKIF